MKKLLALFLLTAWLHGFGQKGLPSQTPTTVVVHSDYPQHEDFSQALTSELKVPDGFEIVVAASGLGKPRMMAFIKGRLYITRRDQGDVLMLSGADQTGKFQSLKTVVADLPDIHF